jgi:hypothetical protein
MVRCNLPPASGVAPHAAHVPRPSSPLGGAPRPACPRPPVRRSCTSLAFAFGLLGTIACLAAPRPGRVTGSADRRTRRVLARSPAARPDGRPSASRTTTRTCSWTPSRARRRPRGHAFASPTPASASASTQRHERRHAVLGVLVRSGRRPEVARVGRTRPAARGGHAAPSRGRRSRRSGTEDRRCCSGPAPRRERPPDRPHARRAMVRISAPRRARPRGSPTNGWRWTGRGHRHLEPPAGWLEDINGLPYDDLLAWWGLLTDGAGPRAPNPAAVRGGALPRIDPDRMTARAIAHFLTDGRQATAEARALLALRERQTARAATGAALASPDPILRRAAERVAEAFRRRAGTDREAVRARAIALLADLPALERAGPVAVAALAEALRTDDSPEALALLLRLLAAVPPRSFWMPALEAAQGAILVRGGDPVPIVDGWLRGATSGPGGCAPPDPTLPARGLHRPARAPVDDPPCPSASACAGSSRSLVTGAVTEDGGSLRSSSPDSPKARGWIRTLDPSGRAGPHAVRPRRPGPARARPRLTGPRRSSRGEPARGSDRSPRRRRMDALLGPVDADTRSASGPRRSKPPTSRREGSAVTPLTALRSACRPRLAET